MSKLLKHEALHTTSILGMLWYNEISEHKFIKKKFKKKAAKIEKLIWELYQDIGNAQI